MKAYEAKQLAERLIATHLTGWSFGWNNRKRSFGLCNYSNRTIYLSAALLAAQSDKGVEQTLLHEIAHALTQGSGHGVLWKRTARSIGVVNPKSHKQADNPEGRPRYNWLLMLGDEIVAGYYRRPQRDVSRLYIPGRRQETLGKLRLVRNSMVPA